jgi:CBS domain-containing protein
MLCPVCGHDNLPGADDCASCHSDLSGEGPVAAHTPLEHSLIHESVNSLGPKSAVTVSSDASVGEAIATMVDNRIGCVLVVDGARVAGIFSERDVLLKLGGRLDEVSDQPVSGFMTADPEMLEGSTRLAFALNRMSLGDFRHLPLTRNGELQGIISLRDFLALLFKWYPDLASEEA